MKGSCACLAIAAGVFWATASTQAQTIWDESIHGDLSNNFASPSGPVNLSLGSNEIHGTTISGDRDYITVVVPANHQLSQVFVDDVTGDDRAFLAVQAGSQVTDPDGPNPAADLLGYTHIGSADGNVGTDVLDDMAVAPGAQGFTPPLPAGTYSFWIQETGGVLVGYSIDLIVTEIPAPGALWLLGMALMKRARRRR